MKRGATLSSSNVGHTKYTCFLYGFQIQNVNLKVERQQAVIAQQHQDIQQQNQDITKLQQDNSKHQQEIQQQNQDITTLQQDNSKQKQDITKLQQDNIQLQQKLTSCSQQIAFDARLSRGTTVTGGQNVVYEVTMLNYGNGYNNSTGVFTCVVPGSNYY